MSKKVVVIGGGPGGYAAAIDLAHLGMEVTLIEKNRIGGTCLNVGCIPTKCFVQAAHAYTDIKKAKAYGVSVEGDVVVDFARTAKFKNKIVKQLTGGVAYLVQAAGVRIVEGTGRMLDAHTVEAVTADGTAEKIEADAIVLATGSREMTIPGFETDGVSVLNSTDMLDIRALPESITIIGGGVIGMEFASVFNAFGKKVTVVELMPRILPLEDEDISRALADALRAKGVEIYTSTKASRITERTDTSVTLEIIPEGEEARTVTSEKMLVCIGRRANMEDIGLEELGIRFNRKYIETNEQMQTNVPNVYAIGDITKSPQLAHVAYHEAMVASMTIAGKEAAADYHAIPGCIYSSPECARVGMTEQQAKEIYGDVQVVIEEFSGNGKAKIEQEAEGFVKLVIDRATGRTVGCSIIGPKATELIAEPSLAVFADMTVEEAAKNINAHPSLSEMIGETFLAAVGMNLHSMKH